MTKIKNIHCFGTSFTAGGGFEFDSSHGHIKKMYYGHIGEELTQYNFSWPGQLQKLLGTNQTVLNHAKQGYGNDRLFRKAYEVINEFDFNTDENLFIFEFAGIGREEFFLKELNSYIVCNYETTVNTENEIYFNYLGSAKSYNYDTKDETDIVEKYDTFFETYLTHLSDFKDKSSKMMRESEMFLSYLESKRINFLFSLPPAILGDYDINKEIEFGDGKYFKKSINFVQFMDFNKLSITDETLGSHTDGHCGIKANKIISNVIYNKLIDSEYINLDIKPIDWKTQLDISIITDTTSHSNQMKNINLI